MIQKRLSLAFSTAVAIAVLTACGGGSGTAGGAGGNTGGNSTIPAPNSGATAPAATSLATQRHVAASAMSAVGDGINYNDVASPGGISSLGIERAQSISRTHVQSSTPTCNNGVEFSQSSIGTGQVTQTIEFFYDSQCTQPYKLVTRTLTFASSTGGSSVGTEELWDQSGNIIAYKTNSFTFALDSNGQLSSIVSQQSVAPAPSASPFAQNGQSCVFDGTNPIDCGNGNVITINAPSASPSPISESIGFTGTIVGETGTPAPSPSPTATPIGKDTAQGGGGWNSAPSQLTLQVNGAGYTGAIGALTLAPAAPPAWAISGGQQALTLTGTVTIAFGGNSGCGSGAPSSVNLTLDDTADGLTVQLTNSGHRLTGSVTNASNQSVATMSLDFSGSGTITYTGGATSHVKDWVIID